MKLYVTGLNAEGRSTIIREEELQTDGGPRPLWRTNESPPAVPARLPDAQVMDLRIPPGQTRWSLFRMPPGYSVGQHVTDSIDYQLVLEGAIDLLLEDGSVASLQPGDCAIVDGVMHGWQAGPDGGLLCAVLLGAKPPA